MPTIVDEYISEENQGGGGGPGGDKLTILQTKKNLTQNYSIDPAYNAASVGPVTTDLGVVVTVPIGSTYVTLPGTGGGGSFPAVENYVIVSDVATPEAGKIYNTIADAITYINTLVLTATNRAMIHVYSKNDSSNFTIPLYCSVVGARENGILSGVISASGIIALDADALNFAKYPTLINFNIAGSIDFSTLSTLLDGNLIIKNCDILLSGGGIITGATYQGVCVTIESFVRRITYQNALIFNIVKSLVGGIFSFSSATTKQVNFENCTIEQQPTFPAIDTTMTIDATTGQMQVIFSNCFIKSKPIVTSVANNGYLITRTCTSNQNSYFDLTGYTGNYINESSTYVKGNLIATATQVDLALDELYITKQAAFKDWLTLTPFKAGDYILVDSILYKCQNDHTSSASFDTDVVDITKWVQLKNTKIRLITASETLNFNDDIILVDASGGDVTISLPTAFGPQIFDKKELSIIRKDNSANIIKVQNNVGANTINGQTGLPQQYQYISFPFQKVTYAYRSNEWYCDGSTITGIHVPTITPGVNVAAVTVKAASYTCTSGVNNANFFSMFGNLVTVNLVLEVESTLAATFSEFELSMPRNLGWGPDDISGHGAIKNATGVGAVFAAGGALNQVKVSFTSLTASPGVDRINLTYNYLTT